MLCFLMGTMTKRAVQPAAVMDEEEFQLWHGLTPEEQLMLMRRAITKGVDSGPSSDTMDEIWARLRARHLYAKP